MLKNKVVSSGKLIGRRSIFHMVVATIAGFLISFLELALTGFLQLFCKAVGLAEGQEVFGGVIDDPELSIEGLVGFLLVVGVLKSLMTFWGAHAGVIARELISSRLKFLSFYQMLFAKDRILSSSEIGFRFSEIIPKSAGFVTNLAIFAPGVVQCLTLVVMMALYSWRLTLVSLTGLLVTGLIIMKINAVIKMLSEILPQEQKKVFDNVERVGRNLFLVKVLRTGINEYKSLVHKTINYSNYALNISAWRNSGTQAPSLLGIVILVSVIFIDLKFFQTPGLVFMGFLYLFLRFIQNLSNVVLSGAGMLVCVPPFRMAVEYYESLPEEECEISLREAENLRPFGSRTPSPEPENRLMMGSKRTKGAALVKAPSIELQDLSYTYPDKDTEIFSGLDFKVEAGAQIGIIGESGSGKSTLLHLILGILKPTQGSIQLDDQEPEDFFTEDLPVGYVGPDSFIIAGSVRNNLDYGARKAYTSQDYWEALKAASLAEQTFHGKGLDYHINEMGDGLSAGQKQRLALARALIAKPKLLILDEASSNLDQETEDDICESLVKLKGECTVIIVSHRPGILKHADVVLDLKQGELKESAGKGAWMVKKKAPAQPELPH